MRFVLCFSLVVALAATIRAQEQDKKLLDRLLRPDTSLQNDAQGKQFVSGGETVTKQAPTKTFFTKQRPAEKGFWNTHRIVGNEFAADAAPDAGKAANLSTRTTIAKTNVSVSTPIYGDVRTAHDATKAVQTSDYPGSRPFLVKGKSQKSLSAQDQPLTIEQVRELLNKNK